MICVVNPDGTITCSDGDAAIAAELTRVGQTAKQGSPVAIGTEYPGDLGQELKGAAEKLAKAFPPMALFIVSTNRLGGGT